jgi:hypothetical protein
MLSLVVRISLEERAELIAAAPDIYYVTDHYLGYPGVLVRLSRVTPERLARHGVQVCEKQRESQVVIAQPPQIQLIAGNRNAQRAPPLSNSPEIAMRKHTYYETYPFAENHFKTTRSSQYSLENRSGLDLFILFVHGKGRR